MKQNMDFSPYLKKGRSTSYGIQDRDRNCLFCGRVLEDKTSFWYKRSFCDESCHSQYVQNGIQNRSPYRHD